jgi:coniferyl-aldehyde dehydrogenase
VKPNDAIALPETLREAFQRQCAARDRLHGLDLPARHAALSRLDRLLVEHGEAFARAIDADFGARARQETLLLEVFPSLAGLRHARRNLRKWSRPRRVPTGFWFWPGRAEVLPQPAGVVGIVVPWNYPLYLAVGPLASAIAAGNRCMVKMPEAAPRTSELFASLVARHFEPELLAVTTGGPEIARAFTALPFDHLLFTGSTSVGREVMQAAAANLTPVTLELGGKSPAIVGSTANVAEAAEKIVFGKCLNAGQTCIAPDYALVPRAHVEAFIAGAREAAARLYPSVAGNPDYSAMIDARHHARLTAWLDEARGRGARIECLAGAGEELSASRKFPPTLVLGAPEDTRIMREEIFGPILPVVPYDHLDEAIAHVNARAHPLALYVFERDAKAIRRVIACTRSGGVTVNDTLLHIAQDELPFGGVGPSGMGAYHGRTGFDTFSRHKAVFHPSRLSGLKLLRPPYGKRFEALIKLLLR